MDWTRSYRFNFHAAVSTVHSNFLWNTLDKKHLLKMFWDYPTSYITWKSDLIEIRMLLLSLVLLIISKSFFTFLFIKVIVMSTGLAVIKISNTIIVLRLRNKPIKILDLVSREQILYSEYWVKFYDRGPWRLLIPVFF